MPGAKTSASVAVADGSVQQVGFLQPGDSCGPGGCGPLTGRSLVGRPIFGGTVTAADGAVRYALSADGCNCGHGACGNTDQADAPCGVVEFAPQGWNLYSVDPQEYICDGGDEGGRARVMRDDSIGGLDPQDTVVHYTSEAGDISVQASNRTCVYSPRFAAVRKVTGAVAGHKALSLSTMDRPVGPNRIDLDLPGLVVSDSASLGHADVAKRIDAIRDLNRGVRVEGDLALIEQSNVLEMMVTLTNLEIGQLMDDQLALIQRGSNAAVRWTLTESVEVAIEDLRAPVLTRDQSLDAFTIYEFPDAGRLRIIKMADKPHAKSGEEVGFAIRVQNVGDSPVNNVVIADSLVTRLAYVEGSQKSDVDAEFSATENKSRSLKLEWKLTDELKVGESALIEFRCKLR